nr:MAG TPA: hypothetical protein [Caudoviricetes sp.]
MNKIILKMLARYSQSAYICRVFNKEDALKVENNI